MTREQRQIQLANLLAETGGRERLTQHLKKLRNWKADERILPKANLISSILDLEFPATKQTVDSSLGSLTD